ncbi:hypothetical protein DEA8626_03214 [Defluviimonas aquaemixtae]|uniref:DUF2141 domain-containing protein n=1 Tax=Albidovulum aquaemixtae TaxID=1542388 RepID=A0A2R8BL93_9RHOB|nr:DUF2141 domain-containing protein [Defluviimonas aquaemixtae]SPH24165.1 hypothetical protein DEA8626_03214 [Defluviimonas aquaemixtae]
MKQVLGALGLISGLGLACTASAGGIELFVTGFSSDAGMARIVLMEGEAGYRGEMPVTRVASVPIRDGRAEWTADDIAPGRYALIAHHDKDADDDLNRPFLGLPQEPYGYSNGAWTSMGLPAWDAVAFDVGAAPARPSIHLRMNAFAAASQMALVGLPALAAIFGSLVFVRRLRRPATV